MRVNTEILRVKGLDKFEFPGKISTCKSRKSPGSLFLIQGTNTDLSSLAHQFCMDNMSSLIV